MSASSAIPFPGSGALRDPEALHSAPGLGLPLGTAFECDSQLWLSSGSLGEAQRRSRMREAGI